MLGGAGKRVGLAVGLELHGEQGGSSWAPGSEVALSTWLKAGTH